MSSTSDLVPVISYARISSDGEGDEHGIGDQHRVNRRTAKRLGFTVVAEMTDNDRSASKANVVREAFESMLRALAGGRLPDGTVVRGVVVLNEDRLARRAGDYERFVEALTADDGRVFADERGSKGLYAEDVEGMGLVGVAFSKIESRKMRRRMKRFHRARAEDGKPAGGTRPFGWAVDRIHLDPAEAPLLAKAAKEFATGRSINSIVREWMALSAAAQSEAGGECCQDEYADADEGDAYGSAAARRVRAGRVRCGHWVYTSTTGSVAGVWGVDRRRIR
jgi:DNA invertase Pin-like site-specific DNA recombinase